jgi:hypothetical protein
LNDDQMRRVVLCHQLRRTLERFSGRHRHHGRSRRPTRALMVEIADHGGRNEVEIRHDPPGWTCFTAACLDDDAVNALASHDRRDLG